MGEGFLSSPTELLWKPLFEAAAETIVGAVGTYSFGKVLSKFHTSNRYDGGMDIWVRGIHSEKVNEGDDVIIDCLISPFAQLFPGDPADNARRWNTLHTFPGKISSTQYQALEFFAGSDAALRIGAINGETLVGIYARYGFVGEGMVGIVPTKLLQKVVPDFFNQNFIGLNARITGRLARCPSQHAYVVQSIAASARMTVDMAKYRQLPYIQINSIKPFSSAREKSISLLGSAWVATEMPSQQYLTEYGYFTNPEERNECIARLYQSKVWKKAAVFFDDIGCPSKTLSFKRLFF